MAKIGLIGFIHEEAKKGFWGTMEKVAQIGYRGIEGGNDLLKGDVSANLKRFHDLGLKVLATSASRERLRDNLDEVIKEAKLLGASRVSVWWGPCNSKEELLRDAELYNKAGARLAEEGLTLCYHNHEHEFQTVFDGVYALDVLAQNTDPKALKFELDIAWISFGGEDPVKVLKRMAGRVPAIHVKDLYDLSDRNSFTAIGTGSVRVKESVEAAIQAGVEWLVVEQDTLRNLTAFETLTLSFLYLKEAAFI